MPGKTTNAPKSKIQVIQAALAAMPDVTVMRAAPYFELGITDSNDTFKILVAPATPVSTTAEYAALVDKIETAIGIATGQKSNAREVQMKGYEGRLNIPLLTYMEKIGTATLTVTITDATARQLRGLTSSRQISKTDSIFRQIDVRIYPSVAAANALIEDISSDGERRMFGFLDVTENWLQGEGFKTLLPNFKFSEKMPQSVAPR